MIILYILVPIYFARQDPGQKCPHNFKVLKNQQNLHNNFLN